LVTADRISGKSEVECSALTGVATIVDDTVCAKLTAMK